MHKSLIVPGASAPQLEGASFQRRAGWRPCSPAAIIGQYNQTVRHRAEQAFKQSDGFVEVEQSIW
jgi:hypothetical protein